MNISSIIPKLFSVVLLFLTTQLFITAQNNHDPKGDLHFLFMSIMNEDKPILNSLWDFSKNDTLELDAFFKIQNDVFGKITPYKTFNYTYSNSEKRAKSFAKFDSIYTKDINAFLTFKVVQETKEPPKISILNVISKSEINNAFIDSISNPYIELIKNNQIDSLVEITFNKSKIDSVIENIHLIKPKKKRKKVLMKLTFATMAMQSTTEALKSINTKEVHYFKGCEINFTEMKPYLIANYQFKSKDKSNVDIKFIYQLKNAQYLLRKLSVRSQIKFD